MRTDQKPPIRQKARLFRAIGTKLPLLVLLGLVAAIIGLSGTIKAEKVRMTQEKQQTLAQQRPPANVVLLEVAPGTMQDRINLPGVIEPWEKLTLLSKVHGTVIETAVQEGDKVTRGEVIARLDPADFQIALDSARAVYELAVADQQRLATLFEQDIIPRAQIEKINAHVKTSKAALENAQLMLSRCTITAPISGVIQRLDAIEGLLLNVSDPVAEILQIDRVKAVVGIPESDVALVRDIEDVTVTVQALDDKQIIGRSHYLASSPENGARLYRLELAVDNGDNQILPGMFFRAQIVKKVHQDAMAVPIYAVIKRRDKQFVYVEKNGVAHQLPVELGIIEDWRVQVTSGLLPGSRVVVEGHRDIDQGRKLNIVRVLSDPREASL
ncbi:MAG: efflux RND transporter periplasmic adaptor subunit [Desulfobacteraceae bacterium]|jgi:membrane fusion protein (multidrug efflux system)